MSKRLKEAKKYIEINSREMDKHLRILRNIDKYKDCLLLPGIYKDEDPMLLKQKFDEFLLQRKVNVFEVLVDHKPFFDLYFAGQASFNTDSYISTMIKAWI